MDIHLKLFEKALTLYEEQACEVNTKSLNNNLSDSLASSLSLDQCQHSETFEDMCKTICVMCGQIVIEKFIITPAFSGLGMRKRKKDESTIYNDIPSHIPQNIKDETISLYLRVMNGEKHRSTAPKRAIILACLYHASLNAKNDISYDDLLEMFQMSQQLANKGFATVYASICAQGEEARVQLSEIDEEKNIIKTYLRKLNMSSFFQPVFALYSLVKTRSRLLHTSIPKSVIAGCMYFWLQYKKCPKTLESLSADMEMSELTIISKYIVIAETLMKAIMKELFVRLLVNCEPRRLEKMKHKQIFKEHPHELLSADKKALVVNPFDVEKISVYNYVEGESLGPENQYPLDEVDDVLDWNILLNGQFYGCELRGAGSRKPDALLQYALNVQIIKNSKNVLLNFKTYDNFNSQDGEKLYRTIVDREIAPP